MDLKEYEKMAEMLKTLAHPVRLAILDGLTRHECNVSKIQEHLKIPQPTVSTHLKLMKIAGIIEGRRQGLQVCYKVINPLAREILKLLHGEKQQEDL